MVNQLYFNRNTRMQIKRILYYFMYIYFYFLAVLGLPSMPLRLFSSCSEWGLLSNCGVQVSLCNGFSCYGTWALGQEGYAASVVAAYPWGFPHGASGKESICQFRLGVRDVGSFPESGSSPGEGNGNPLQYSCLENHKDRGA